MGDLREHTRERWNELAVAGVIFSRPWLDLTEQMARERVDPLRLLGQLRDKRVLCLAGAAAAEVAALDTVYVDFRDSEGFRRECEEARRDGFSGKMAIHPAQVPIINELFTPTPEALAHAQAIVDAFAANPDAGVVAIGGVMVDRPHLAQAKRVLARAASANS